MQQFPGITIHFYIMYSSSAVIIYGSGCVWLPFTAAIMISKWHFADVFVAEGSNSGGQVLKSGLTQRGKWAFCLVSPLNLLPEGKCQASVFVVWILGTSLKNMSLLQVFEQPCERRHSAAILTSDETETFSCSNPFPLQRQWRARCLWTQRSGNFSGIPRWGALLCLWRQTAPSAWGQFTQFTQFRWAPACLGCFRAPSVLPARERKEPQRAGTGIWPFAGDVWTSLGAAPRYSLPTAN